MDNSVAYHSGRSRLPSPAQAVIACLFTAAAGCARWGFERPELADGLGPGVGVIFSSATCSDGERNGGETAIDCGGSTCGPCPDDAGCSGQGCSIDVCDANLCRVPTCADGVLNQDESSTACGGACGSTCSALQASLVHCYRFEGTGTTIRDFVGSADGVLVNTSLSGSGSVSLAGGSSGQHVSLPNGIVSSLVDATFCSTRRS